MTLPGAAGWTGKRDMISTFCESPQHRRCGDGVTVVPRKHIPEVVPRVLEKASIESEARQLLLEGGYLRDVWENFRVL